MTRNFAVAVLCAAVLGGCVVMARDAMLVEEGMRERQSRQAARMQAEDAERRRIDAIEKQRKEAAHAP